MNFTFHNFFSNRFVERSEIARIGGRCQDPELEAITLASIKKNTSSRPKYKDNQHSLLKDDIAMAKETVEKTIDNLLQMQTLHHATIVRKLSKQQEVSLLLNCDWTKLDIAIDFEEEKKKIKKTKINKAFLQKILNSDMYNKYKANLDYIKLVAFKKWLPSSHDFDEYEKRIVGDQQNNRSTLIKSTEKTNRKIVGSAVEKSDQRNEEDGKRQTGGSLDEEQTERMSSVVGLNPRPDSYKLNSLIPIAVGKCKKGEYVKAFSPSALARMDTSSSGLLFQDNLWEWNTDDRIKFVQTIIASETDKVRELFTDSLTEYNEMCKEKGELNTQHIAETLNNRKSLG